MRGYDIIKSQPRWKKVGIFYFPTGHAKVGFFIVFFRVDGRVDEEVHRNFNYFIYIFKSLGL